VSENSPVAPESNRSSFFREPAGLRIAQRQAIFFALMAFLIVGALSVALFQSVRTSLLEQHQNRVETLATASLDRLENALAASDNGAVQDLLNEVVEAEEIDFVVAYGAEGEVLAHTFEPFFPENLLQRSSDGWSDGEVMDLDSSTNQGTLEWSASVPDGTLRVGSQRQHLNSKALQTMAPFVLAALLIVPLGALFFFGISRRLSRDVEAIAEISRSVAEGREQSWPAAESGDLSLLRESVRDAFDALKYRAPDTPVQVQAPATESLDQAELQTNINRFLGVATEVAMGDLSQRGAVTADVLGNVVDAINVVIEQMDDTVFDVRTAAEEVARGSESVIGTSEQAEDAAREQLDLVEVAKLEVGKATALADRISQQALASSSSAASTSEVAEQGRVAVREARNEMAKVRDQVAAVSRRIKGLGERSLEVSEIAETISSISYQTNLLAVNAAIEASGAGEAGQRFSVVAEEVRRLAEDTARAARKIDDLVSDFQPEVQAAVKAMDQSSHEVEEGFRATERAETNLGEIEEASKRADALAREIVEQASYQTGGMGRVSTAVASIAVQSESTLELVSKGQSVSSSLRSRAQDLIAQLSSFTLSERAQPAPVLAPAAETFVAPAPAPLPASPTEIAVPIAAAASVPFVAAAFAPVAEGESPSVEGSDVETPGAPAAEPSGFGPSDGNDLFAVDLPAVEAPTVETPSLDTPAGAPTAADLFAETPGDVIPEESTPSPDSEPALFAEPEPVEPTTTEDAPFVNDLFQEPVPELPSVAGPLPDSEHAWLSGDLAAESSANGEVEPSIETSELAEEASKEPVAGAVSFAMSEHGLIDPTQDQDLID